ncbi:MAG: hypothetical protein HC880_01430 [Bacteroidia bacterium]|nr:hypothetical protein [Bacteroidia bacterium]
MQDLSQHIALLREQADIWPKVAPLVEHITYLEAELRLARLRLDDQANKMKSSGETMGFSSIQENALNKDLNLEERNLYRAVGELAFVIAKADNILRDSERKAFHDAIVRFFGENYWIDRFQLIDSTPATDLESTYRHVIFMIRQNKQALNDDLVDKFIKIICEVAEVTSIHEQQQVYIDRFREDLNRINAN